MSYGGAIFTFLSNLCFGLTINIFFWMRAFNILILRVWLTHISGWFRNENKTISWNIQEQKEAVILKVIRKWLFFFEEGPSRLLKKSLLNHFSGTKSTQYFPRKFCWHQNGHWSYKVILKWLWSYFIAESTNVAISRETEEIKITAFAQKVNKVCRKQSSN